MGTDTSPATSWTGPSTDAIEEFKLQRSTFGAEFGRSSAVINTTIRSGTNDVHLALFEFLRNRNFDANDFFANRTGSKKPAFTQNNFWHGDRSSGVVPRLQRQK